MYALCVIAKKSLPLTRSKSVRYVASPFILNAIHTLPHSYVTGYVLNAAKKKKAKPPSSKEKEKEEEEEEEAAEVQRFVDTAQVSLTRVHSL